jgi:hypothetical protein
MFLFSRSAPGSFASEIAMRRKTVSPFIPALAAIAFAAVAFLASPATPAAACTPVPGYDAIQSSPLIVEGRVLGWHDVGNTQIQYELAVDRVLKGDATHAGTTLQVRDFGSYDRGQWVTSGGLCGTFAGDPTGNWVVMGLSMQDGSWRSELRTSLYNAPQPGSSGYDETIARILDATAPGPPATGSGFEQGETSSPVILIFGALVIAAVVGLRASRGRSG